MNLMLSDAKNPVPVKKRFGFADIPHRRASKTANS